MSPLRRFSRLTLPSLALLGAFSLLQPAAAQTAPKPITVQVNKPGAAISPIMFGLFFEDINFAADGGLYPELVKNRSFEISDRLLGWKPIKGGSSLETFMVLDKQPVAPDNPHYLRIKSVQDTPDEAGALNEGFRGMGLKQGAEYTFSIYARQVAGPGVKALRMTLEDTKGQALGQATISSLTPEWKKYTAVIKPTATFDRARMKLVLDGSGTVDIDAVSLYPKDTWNQRQNGLRTDLVQLLKDMKPGFLRFPGGCIVEGRTLDNRYQWKETIGNVESRVPQVNRWNTEFKHRFTPDYYQSLGLGFFEYFQLSEDIGAEPLPILNCGMACQFNSSELVPLEGLDPYIQDALDLIEFANGPVTSTWGAKRAAMGHPAPFNLKLMGVGNEQWGPQYMERYIVMAKAIKAKYPNIKIVSSGGPSPDGAGFDFLTAKLREQNADIIDEHYYQKPEWFQQNVNRYDKYPRKGPKIFAGEYAAQSAGIARQENRNNWLCALSEAAYLTGLERNADLVQLASYAPLFAHTDAWQWTPNLIWFDNLRSFGTPSYYVQKLFSTNKGTTMLPVAQANGQDSVFTSASIDAAAGEIVLKLVNTAGAAKPVHINLEGAKKLRKTGKASVLTYADLKAENTLQEPTKISPTEQQVAVSGSEFNYTLAPRSVTVLRIGSGAISAAASVPGRKPGA
jgi:alpha-N-arabinofuranosidase